MSRFLSWVYSPKVSPFIPKSVVCLLEGYSFQKLQKDVFAGLTVSFLSLPVAMAFAIAAGVDPERGLYTAIIAGFLSSLLGGSRFLVSGPTGAFAVLLFGIVEKFGYSGLACATFEASIFLFLLGFFRCGTLIRFIPYPVVVGFTGGIALVLASSQMKDFLGLSISQTVPDFLDKMYINFTHLSSTNFWAVAIALGTLFTIISIKIFSPRLPAIIVALVVVTAMSTLFSLPVETIQSKFGVIPSSLPHISFPEVSFELMRKTFPDAVGIALLGAIESLLCAVVADGMTGTRHKSNCELMAQGVANFGSLLFGGIPSTGTVARTVANVQMQARTPIAGMVQAMMLLVFMMVFAPIVSQIPLAALAAVIVYVSWNMFEFKQIKELCHVGWNEALITLITLIVTVLVDLNAAVKTGVLLSVIMFMKKSTETSTVNVFAALEKEEHECEVGRESDGVWKYDIPKHVKVYELTGPLFFAVAAQIMDVFHMFDATTKTLIIRMRSVPFVDATGIRALKRVDSQAKAHHIQVMLVEIKPNVYQQLVKSEFFTTFDKDRIFQTLKEAISSVPPCDFPD